MKNIPKKTKIFILTFSILLILIPLIIFADTTTTTTCPPCPEGTYQFETGIPFFAKQCECKPISQGISGLIVSLLPKLFIIAGILAFAMIVWAGFEYATSGGDTNRQKDAQDRIVNAIIGLVLLFAFWIIIYTINPDILKTQEPQLTPVNLPSASTQVNTVQANMTKLNDYQIPLSYQLLNDYAGNAYADNNLGDLLHALFMNTYYTKNSSGIYEPRTNPLEWYVTEACITNTLPCQTTYNGHETGSCHYSGTCVDIVLKNETEANKQEFIKIAKSVGLSIYNEYDKNCWTSGTTADHFHVALTCGGSGSCWLCP